jgi:hypothetical protein
MIVELIERLTQEAAKQELEFLLIGGHAVGYHGYARMTLDVDFLVRFDDRKGWSALLGRFHYVPHTESTAFMQFASQTPGWPAVDLMFVHDDTWAKLKAGAVRKSHGREQIHIPEVRHLIALKLHAAKSPTRSSPDKDWNDIEELLRRHKLDPDDPEFMALILRYGGEESLARMRKVWQDYLREAS